MRGQLPRGSSDRSLSPGTDSGYSTALSSRDPNDTLSSNLPALASSNVLARSATTTQARVTQSDDTLLHMVWRQRSIVLVCMIGGIFLGLIYVLHARKLYTSESEILVERAGPSLIGNNGGGDTAPASDNIYLNTQVELIRSAPILALAIDTSHPETLQMFKGIPNRISYLKNALSVDVGKNDSIITVALESAYPDDAKIILNGVVQAYRDFQDKQKRSTAGDEIAILEHEKEKRDAELAEKNRQLTDLLESGKTLSFGGNDAGNVMFQRVSALSAAVTQAQVDTATALSNYQQAASAAGVDTTQPDWTEKAVSARDALELAADGVNEDAIRDEIFRLHQQLESLSHQYMPGHPAMQGMRQRIEQLNHAVVAAARQRWLATRDRQNALQASLDVAQKQAIEQNAKSMQYSRLDGDVRRLQDLSDELDKRIKVLAITQQAGAMNVTMVEPAYSSDGPTSPKKSRDLALAAAAGIAFGVVLGLLREVSGAGVSLRSSIGSKNLLNLPVFTAVPRQSEIQLKSVAWSAHLRPDSTIAASFREVRDALEAAAAGDAGLVQARTVVITSSVRGEGRTIAASNLAITLAKGGKRVCLVDADLRNGVIARIFSTREEVGLTSVLVGIDPLLKAVQRTVIERLDLLPAGPAAEDPADLLNSPQFIEALEELTLKYDHVVIDTPSVLTAPDARIVAASSDATLFVVSGDGASRRVAEQCRDGLLSVGARIVGVISNSAPRVGRQKPMERSDRGREHRSARVGPETSRSESSQLPVSRPPAETSRT